MRTLQTLHCDESGKYHATMGCDISTAIELAIRKANSDCHFLVFEFNGIELTVRPDATMSAVIDDWSRQRWNLERKQREQSQRIIESQPLLLAACEEAAALLRFVEGKELSGLFIRLNAAIAKAKGEA